MMQFWNWLWGRAADYPKTFQQFAADKRLDRSKVFDPALQHYSSAFRNGEPVFHHADVAETWLRARRIAMDHLLGLIARSGYGPDLVLRGSRVLKEWFGASAREPGDLDWVVRSNSMKPSDPWWTNFVDALQRMLRDQESAGNVQLLGNRIALDHIWNYDRLPGRRIVVPWTTDNSLQGSIQMDFAFEEDLWVDPITTSIKSPSGQSFDLAAASKELSLAWKILWLETDSYPQGKDLYDAVLLAEDVVVPFELLERVLRDGDARQELTAAMAMSWNVEWDDFKREYPWVEGDCEKWKERLWKALIPTFQTAVPDGSGT